MAKKNDDRIKVYSGHSLLNQTQQLIVATTLASLCPDESLPNFSTVPMTELALLKPKQWVSDAAINAYTLLLSLKYKRNWVDSQMLENALGNADRRKRLGGADDKVVSRVRRTHQTLTAKAFEQSDIIIFPVNHRNMHWVCAWLDFKTKFIHVYDSLYEDMVDEVAMVDTFQKLEAWLDFVEYGSDGWTRTPANGPTQANGYDCGVFTMCAMRCVAQRRELDFDPALIDAYRESLACQILSVQILD
jgi:sentrin-specific protease 1